jgi:hypothetical protein
MHLDQVPGVIDRVAQHPEEAMIRVKSSANFGAGTLVS